MSRRAVIAVVGVVVLAGGVTIAVVRLTGGEPPRGSFIEQREGVPGGLPALVDVPLAIPGYRACARPGPGCRFVELTVGRYAELVGVPAADFVHDNPAIAACGRPEVDAEGAPPCEEPPQYLTVDLVMRAADAAAFERTYGCGEPVVDPCT